MKIRELFSTADLGPSDMMMMKSASHPRILCQQWLAFLPPASSLWVAAAILPFFHLMAKKFTAAQRELN